MLKDILTVMPLVAILRGIKPSESVEIAKALYDTGVRCIEVPLNSPDAFNSIGLIAAAMPPDCLVGAGTVLTVADVAKVKEVGGKLIVTPNSNPEVIRYAVEAEMDIAPGVATPTEAFAAIHAGAQFLKLFPANTYGTTHLRALLAVLPKTCNVLAVGGIAVADIPHWRQAGAIGFGVASEIYRPGDGAIDVVRKATPICKILAPLKNN